MLAIGIITGLGFAALLLPLRPGPATDEVASRPDPIAEPKTPADPNAARTGEEPDSSPTAGGADVKPRRERWRAGAREVYPNAKRLASRVVERLTTYDVDSRPQSLARAITRQFGGDRGAIRDAARQLVMTGTASSGAVVYPQLAGVRPDKASVMVVVDQSLDDGEQQRVERRTVDVRLRMSDGEWSLDAILSAGGRGVPRPEGLSTEAVAVLGHPRIRLTDSARWDIYAGVVNDRLLSLMAAAADRYEIGVTTLATGHPYYVFETDIKSNHTKGRAVDIFSVDGKDVVDQRKKGSAAFKLTRWLFNQGVPELGAPWALDGYGGRSFTDVVHEDHIHVAV